MTLPTNLQALEDTALAALAAANGAATSRSAAAAALVSAQSGDASATADLAAATADLATARTALLAGWTAYLQVGAAPPPSGAVVLEDFATLRNNASGQPLWGVTVNANQTGSLSAASFDANVSAASVGGSDPGCGLYVHFWPYPYSAANQEGYAKAWLKSGTFDPNCNRLAFWLKPSISRVRRADGGATLEFGTYIHTVTPTGPNDQGVHYYHLLDPNLYDGKWHLLIINRHPQHQVGQDPNTNWPDNPTAPVNYFDGLGRFYLEEDAFAAADKAYRAAMDRLTPDQLTELVSISNANQH